MIIPAIEEVRNVTAGVDGWLTDDEGELLFNLARSCGGKGEIVEIGSWKGRSTIWLGKGSMAGNRVRVWAIDPHTGSAERHRAFGSVDTLNEFKQNITRAGLDALVSPIVKASNDAATSFEGPVELAFIDGAHDYESAKTDFEAWFPKVVEGGTIAYHDATGWDGPRRVVLENICRSRKFGAVRLVGSIAYASRVRENTVQDRLRNSLMARIIGSSLRRTLPRPAKRLVRKAGRAMRIFR